MDSCCVISRPTAGRGFAGGGTTAVPVGGCRPCQRPKMNMRTSTTLVTLTRRMAPTKYSRGAAGTMIMVGLAALCGTCWSWIRDDRRRVMRVRPGRCAESGSGASSTRRRTAEASWSTAATVSSWYGACPACRLGVQAAQWRHLGGPLDMRRSGGRLGMTSS